MFDNEVPAIINMMHDLTVGVLGHQDITSKLDLDLRIKYTERILIRPELKKFWQVLLECKYPAKKLAGYQWSLGSTNIFTIEQLWTWTRLDRREGTGQPTSVLERCD